MAQFDYEGPNGYTSNISGTTSATVTLKAPHARQANRIHWISAIAAGATAATITVYKNDGTTVIAQIGQGTDSLGHVHNFPGGLYCAPADAAKVTLAATAASSCTVSVGWDLVAL